MTRSLRTERDPDYLNTRVREWGSCWDSFEFLCPVCVCVCILCNSPFEETECLIRVLFRERGSVVLLSSH